MIAGTPVRALRVTYVGELGWELHMPIDSLASVYDALMKAGAAARHPQRRLSRDRKPAPGEILSRLVERHLAPTIRRWKPAWAGR